MSKDFLLIGLDGGATKVNGWSIEINHLTEEFSLGKTNARKAYADYITFHSDFKPVDIQTQLSEYNNNSVNPTPEEKRQADAYIVAGVDVVTTILKHTGFKPVLLGIGMPGLKTRDKRGIAAMVNGPRIPQYADILEQRLEIAGVELITPISKLGSDADYCGIGEEYAVEGSFKDCDNVYYLGGGTGAADALKLHGDLIPFDTVKGWIAKTWELKNQKNISLEHYASANGIQYIYSHFIGGAVEELNIKKIYPEHIFKNAIKGDLAAQQTFAEISYYLALLLYERITTIYCGWQSILSFVDSNRAALKRNHDFHGILLDRIVIGQRLGNLFEMAKATDYLWKPLLNQLTVFIKDSDCLDGQAKEHYLKYDKFNAGIIFISKLREAPALGAGIDVYYNWSKSNASIPSTPSIC